MTDQPQVVHDDPEGKLEWQSIANEFYRIYHYSDGSTFSVDAPEMLAVKRGWNGDSHRIITKGDDRPNVYVAPGWIAISWEGKF